MPKAYNCVCGAKPDLFESHKEFLNFYLKCPKCEVIDINRAFDIESAVEYWNRDLNKRYLLKKDGKFVCFARYSTDCGLKSPWLYDDGRLLDFTPDEIIPEKRIVIKGRDNR